ncbi:TPA: hypothetical protein HA317_01885, partial [Candidatus Woesearchaeota archaeon]|nr:hypothetical protein [Candidatus Woesearchaeota archaeon]
KHTRLRGNRTHGWGDKKHRGSGNRGGKGNAGTGKRSDCRKPSVWKYPELFGKHGFRKKNIKVTVKGVNVSYIEEHINSLISSGAAKESNGVFDIDLEKAGYNKLLGRGRVNKKLRIKTAYASKRAVEAVEKAGGSVEGLTPEEKKKPADKPAKMTMM